MSAQPPRDETASALLEQIAAKRGYVLDMHRVLAEHDPGFLRAYEELLDSAYIRERALDRRVKELVYVAVLTVLSAPRDQLVAHMVAARSAGATPREVLEVLEQVMPPAGVPRFIEGIEAWSAAFDEGSDTQA